MLKNNERETLKVFLVLNLFISVKPEIFLFLRFPASTGLIWAEVFEPMLTGNMWDEAHAVPQCRCSESRTKASVKLCKETQLSAARSTSDSLLGWFLITFWWLYMNFLLLPNFKPTFSHVIPYGVKTYSLRSRATDHLCYLHGPTCHTCGNLSAGASL